MELRAREHVRRGARTELFKIMEKRGHDRLSSGVWERPWTQEDELAAELIGRAVRRSGPGSPPRSTCSTWRP